MSRTLEPQELIALLERSTLPTIIIEGSDDVIIYREFEKRLNNVDVLPVGGRNTILEIFQEKIQNPNLINKKIVFIADKDIWVNQCVPSQYMNPILIFTDGYSIENDVFRDYGCEEILQNQADRNIYLQYKEDIRLFLQWYALALQSLLNNSNNLGNDFRKLSSHPHEVLNRFNDFIQLIGNEVYPNQLVQELSSDYLRLIRGKSLLAVFTKNLKHHKDKAIFESVAIRPGEYIEKIFNQVKVNFLPLD